MRTDLHTRTWRQAFGSPQFIVQLALTLIALLLLGFYIDRFFGYVQAKAGARWNDVVLSLLPAYDVSLAIFTLIYSAVVISIVNLAGVPYLLLRTVQAYIFLVLLRAIAMLTFPLEPPDEIIPLRDPLVELFFYNDQVITKDLFFSGLVETLD
jgi:hypothetical protein